MVAMEMIYLLLPIIGAFVFLFLGCCFGRKMKEMLHFPKQVVLGRAVMEQLPGVRIQESDSESEDDGCPAIRVKFRDHRGRQFTGFIPSSASRDSVNPSSCSDSGVALLSASRQSIPPVTSVSGLLKRRYLDVDNVCSPSRMSLDSAIHTSRTYNFSSITSVDSEDEDDTISVKDHRRVKCKSALARNSCDSANSDSASQVVYGPPNWDHVIIIESLPDSLANPESVPSNSDDIHCSASSLSQNSSVIPVTPVTVSTVTDTNKKHSFQDFQTLYDSGLCIRHNPLTALPQWQSLHNINTENDQINDSSDTSQQQAKRLSVSLCSISDKNVKDSNSQDCNIKDRNINDRQFKNDIEDLNQDKPTKLENVNDSCRRESDIKDSDTNSPSSMELNSESDNVHASRRTAGNGSYSSICHINGNCEKSPPSCHSSDSSVRQSGCDNTCPKTHDAMKSPKKLEAKSTAESETDTAMKMERNTIKLPNELKSREQSHSNSLNNSQSNLDNSNGNLTTVETPGVFPLLTGIAALVDNMKESDNATLRKVSGNASELCNNNCCVEMNFSENQPDFDASTTVIDKSIDSISECV